MTSVKIRFKPSAVPGQEGSLYYRIIRNRTVRQIPTGCRLFAEEWDSGRSEPVDDLPDGQRSLYLHSVRDRIRQDIGRLTEIIASLERLDPDYTAEDVADAFSERSCRETLSGFMREIVCTLQAAGKIRTSETYTAALRSFLRFRGGEDIALDRIDSDLMEAYEAYLRSENVSKNSSSFYLRNLRAVYNRAVGKRLTTQRFPFRSVYTGVDKTVKRAVPLKVIRQLRDLPLQASPSLDFARDMFLFSFYTRGMAFVDMAYLKKRDLAGRMLSYRRKKTGQQLHIRWEACMQQIVDKYSRDDSPYLLPIIIKEGADERRQYRNTGHLVNRKLKKIGEMLGLSVPLTMYVARHAWASIARSRNVPISVISEGMGHDSETTTQIYLASLDTEAVDRANRMILKLL